MSDPARARWDALAAAEAALHEDNEELGRILDGADTRAVASMLASMMTVLLFSRTDDPETVLAGCRAMYGAG